MDIQSIIDLAYKLHQAGRLSDAFDLYRRVKVQLEENSQFLFLFGTLHGQIGELESSIEILDKSIKLNPNNSLAFNNRGLFLNNLNRPNDALISCDRAITLEPNYADAHNNRGNALRALNQFDEAITSYDQAIALKPDYAEPYYNRGVVLYDLHRIEEAITSYDQAIALKPDYAEAYNNRGTAFYDLNLVDEGLKNYDQSIALKPCISEAHNNRGTALHDLKRFDEALKSYNQAITLKSDYALAYWNKALLFLLTGNYREGWELYEYRWVTKSLKFTRRIYQQKLWIGDQGISGKTILIYPEQGLGDVIQFSRYVPLLVQKGARVIFEVPQTLVGIMQTLSCDLTIVESGSEIPSFDLHCPIMTLPLAFKTTIKTIPNKVPYIFCDANKSAYWKQKILNRSTFQVGLVWSGGLQPNRPELWAINEKRNIPLKKLETLNIPGVNFYSLQKGGDAIEQLIRLKECNWRGPDIFDFSDDLKDFSDTAALIENLDLVITVDTSIAHIAGAMGKSVWLLNRFNTDWRWFIDKDISPWYPTIRIFRQPTLGDWDSVISNVRDALKNLTL